MKTGAVGLNHFNIKVPLDKLEKIKEFYCGIVGLAPGWRPPFNSVGYWLYAGDDAIVHLVGVPGGESPGDTTSTTVDHLAFSCSGFEGMEGLLGTHGISYKLTIVPERGLRQLVFRDPVGNGIELVFPKAGE